MRKSAEIASQDDLTSAGGIIRTINTIAIELEASIIKNEVDATASLFTKILDSLPQLIEMVSEDVLLSCSQVVTASGLEGFDLLFGHIDE
jgi:hypothetical protein